VDVEEEVAVEVEVAVELMVWDADGVAAQLT
jgi:hypothetical protein